jgi:tellurite resistance protein
VMEVELIGLEQSQWFDTVHLRVRARMRDTDVEASASEAQALAAARRAPSEAFTEVWSFVRKPGVTTRLGQDVFQGKCPQCGAPFAGGAANRCEHCGAIVNSGNYDWTLSEITQGVEHVPSYAQVDNLMEARETDPALNLEMLEDRASLLFWKWIDAQSRASSSKLHKVAAPAFIAQVDQELEALGQRQQRKVFLECAVGGVTVRGFERGTDGFDHVEVEVRWSARMGLAPLQGKPSRLPTVPQRWVFTMMRRQGARTNTDNGMSTDRCPQCNAPLTDSAATTCDYCGTELGSGMQDWVLLTADSFEAWNARAQRRFDQTPSRRAPGRRRAIPLEEGSATGTPQVVRGTGAQQFQAVHGGSSPEGPARVDDVITDPQERQRLLYMMAALAASDGTVDKAERKLLELCARRWSVPWSNVEMALNAGPNLFTRLVQRRTPEAEVFLHHLVEMALVDGKIDRKERQMLEFAAGHLDLRDRLTELLGGR